MYQSFNNQDFCKTPSCICQTSNSSCHDKVAEYICNKHAAYFGLVFKERTMENLSGENVTDIVAYAIRPINIPCFITGTGLPINMMKISEFVARVKNENKLSDKDAADFRNALCISVGISPMSMVINSSINNANIVCNNIVTQEIQSINATHLPPLYHALLHNIPFSCLMASDASWAKVNIENLILQTDGTDFSIKTIAPEYILKYTSHHDCIATPLVFGCFKTIQNATSTITSFQHIPCNQSNIV